jgi:hypothetical protein
MQSLYGRLRQIIAMILITQLTLLQLKALNLFSDKVFRQKDPLKRYLNTQYFLKSLAKFSSFKIVILILLCKQEEYRDRD